MALWRFKPQAFQYFKTNPGICLSKVYSKTATDTKPTPLDKPTISPQKSQPSDVLIHVDHWIRQPWRIPSPTGGPRDPGWFPRASPGRPRAAGAAAAALLAAAARELRRAVDAREGAASGAGHQGIASGTEVMKGW